MGAEGTKQSVVYEEKKNELIPTPEAPMESQEKPRLAYEVGVRKT